MDTWVASEGNGKPRGSSLAVSATELSDDARVRPQVWWLLGISNLHPRKAWSACEACVSGGFCLGVEVPLSGEELPDDVSVTADSESQSLVRTTNAGQLDVAGTAWDRNVSGSGEAASARREQTQTSWVEMAFFWAEEVREMSVAAAWQRTARGDTRSES